MKKFIDQLILTFCIGMPIANLLDTLHNIVNDTSTFNFILNIITGIALTYASWIISGRLLKDRCYGRK